MDKTTKAKGRAAAAVLVTALLLHSAAGTGSTHTVSAATGGTYLKCMPSTEDTEDVTEETAEGTECPAGDTESPADSTGTADAPSGQDATGSTDAGETELHGSGEAATEGTGEEPAEKDGAAYTYTPASGTMYATTDMNVRSEFTRT